MCTQIWITKAVNKHLIYNGQIITLPRNMTLIVRIFLSVTTSFFISCMCAWCMKLFYINPLSL